ncbi:MAG: 3'-5' exonuclease [Eubacteriales bacterium]|nr:3'-5' exonuclease [Eubacteriales bacterium]
MNYIVLDLEWNQSSSSSGENPRLPFEVIEIGATKLDEHFNILDQYGSIIKPRVYRRLQSRIREILNYDETELRSGRPFDVVYREFKKWCGEDFIFCTWGPLDLTYLQQNMDFYYLKSLEFPLKFYNLQEIYAINYYNDKYQMPSLEKAVTELKLTIDEPFHCAKNDAYYTAVVFQKMKKKHLSDMYSIDYYHHPTSIEDEITAKHLNYIEYITRPFENRMNALDDKNIITMRCYKCNRKITKKIKWFVNNSSTHVCVGKCWSHGLTCGKLRFKSTSDGNVFVIKTAEKINKKDYERIRTRQSELQKKRREKRRQKKIAG